MSDERWGMCAAFGCPLPGSMPGDGRWYCFCHYAGNPATNDAITAILRRHQSLVVAALQARSSGSVAAINEAERVLLDLTAEARPAAPPEPGPRKVQVPMPKSAASFHPYGDGSDL